MYKNVLKKNHTSKILYDRIAAYQRDVRRIKREIVKKQEKLFRLQDGIKQWDEEDDIFLSVYLGLYDSDSAANSD